MDARSWWREFPGAVTVCDRAGVILEMNESARRVFASDGGAALIGKNALDCHPEPARTRLRGLLAEGRSNVYTIEKRGVRKLIYQAPWFESGVYAGFVELSLEIPAAMPHFVRG
ncbi:MAG: PAS domain-containing protein [Acidobacteriota bacterium]|nr:PAS domain-containing protein [Acidobacteriota bacterium]